jgi:hypothetical protein
MYGEALMARLWLLAVLMLAACGNGPEDRPLATEVVAQKFMASPQPPAPTPELQEQITFMDTCAVKLIRASDITYETPQDAITAKVRGFMKQCETELHARLDRKQPLH